MGKKNTVQNQQPKSKLKFEVRSAFPAEVLPFVKDLGDKFHTINDNIPIIQALEKSKTWQQKNFGKAPATSYKVLNSYKNIVEIEVNGVKHEVYEKTIHLMDAFKTIRYGKKYPEERLKFLWGQYDEEFLNNPNNQAYVDVASSYFASTLHEQLGSPHFVKFFQTFRGIAKNYKFNITDDVSSYRFSNWFWASYDANTFSLEVFEKETENPLTQEEILQLLRPDPDLCCDSDSDEDEESSSSNSVESLPEINQDNLEETEIESVKDFGVDSDEVEILKRRSGKDTSDKYNNSSSSEFDMYTIYAIIKEMPVIVMHTERMTGIMDDLLEDEEFDGTWELRWTAWIFQVIVALIQLQSNYQLVHNDLHTNNILWKETEEEFFTYKDKTGKLFKIPTFGKRFVIIDFGRATFTFNGTEICSSDFFDGADAEGQYNYGVWRNKNEPLVRPNPSFDLTRLSTSLTRVLFSQNPPEKMNSPIMSREDKWIVRETTSDLFNMLWTWLVDTEQENILETEDGDEKFPGFDLYQHIANSCKKARPDDWINKTIFSKFVVKSTEDKCIIIP